MHAQHMANKTTDSQTADRDFSAMQQRGGEAMGFDQNKTTHHFLLAGNGGRIVVTANSASDTESVASIRKHLHHIAEAFAHGDFSIPMQVHNQPPSGTAEMARLKQAITYRYEDVADGGAVVIGSDNPEAIAAIHDFLKFQVTEHHTGDAMTANH
jgi:hypothetical protein